MHCYENKYHCKPLQLVKITAHHMLCLHFHSVLLVSSSAPSRGNLLTVDFKREIAAYHNISARVSSVQFADYKYRKIEEKIVTRTFLAHRTVLNEAKKRASPKRWGVFDAGRIIGTNKL